MKFIYIILTVILCSCQSNKNNGEMELFPLSNVYFDRVYYDTLIDDTVYDIKVEYFVVRNAPEGKIDIYEAFNNYSDSTLDSNFHKYDKFIREFYHETKETPIDFKEKKGGWNPDVIEHHTDDLFFTMHWEKGKLTRISFVDYPSRDTYRPYDGIPYNMYDEPLIMKDDSIVE